MEKSDKICESRYDAIIKIVTEQKISNQEILLEKLKELGLKPVVHGVVLWIVLATLWGAAIHLGWVHCVK